MGWRAEFGPQVLVWTPLTYTHAFHVYLLEKCDSGGCDSRKQGLENLMNKDAFIV